MNAKSYIVRGMTCAACSARVEKAARSVDGVKECAVNLLTGSMTVSGDASDSAVISAVEKAGYGCSVVGVGKNNDKTKSDNDDIYEKESRTLFSRAFLASATASASAESAAAQSLA